MARASALPKTTSSLFIANSAVLSPLTVTRAFQNGRPNYNSVVTPCHNTMKLCLSMMPEPSCSLSRDDVIADYVRRLMVTGRLMDRAKYSPYITRQ
jgi:hypothetical protein